jgi:hypothetical protein
MNKNLDTAIIGWIFFLSTVFVILIAFHKHTPKFERDCSIFEHSLATTLTAGYDEKGVWSQERQDLAEMGTRISNLESVNRCLLDVINR